MLAKLPCINMSLICSRTSSSKLSAM